MEFTTHETTIYYESIGSGIPVIMIHGWGPDHRSMKGCMEPVFSVYEGTFKRIYFDLPGTGKTKGGDFVSDGEKLIDLIISFIDGIIPDQDFILIGNSHGGYLAKGIVKKCQQRIRGLFLLCPSPEKKIKAEFRVLEKEDSLNEIIPEEDKSFFYNTVIRQNIRNWMRFREEILPGLKSSNFDYIHHHWGKDGYAFNFDTDNLKVPLDKPVLIIMGNQDSFVGHGESLNIYKDYPRATFVILDNAGHALQIEQPDLFNCLTKEWLNRIEISENMN